MPGSKKRGKILNPVWAKSKTLQGIKLETFQRQENLKGDHLVASTIYEVSGKRRQRSADTLAFLVLKNMIIQSKPIPGFETNVLPKATNGDSGTAVVYFTAPNKVGQEALNAATAKIVEITDVEVGNLPIIQLPK
jgi:hypothetical protein